MNEIVVDRLPKWAQEHIRHLRMERDEAVKALNRYLDDQKKSRFFTVEHLCTGEQRGPSFKRRYIQTFRCVVVTDGDHEFELGFDNHERLTLRCTTGRLSIDPDSSNNILVSAKH